MGGKWLIPFSEFILWEKISMEFTVFGQTAKLSPQIYVPLTAHWQCHSLRMHEDCWTRAIVTGCVGRVLTQPLFKATTTFLPIFMNSAARPADRLAAMHVATVDRARDRWLQIV